MKKNQFLTTSLLLSFIIFILTSCGKTSNSGYGGSATPPPVTTGKDTVNMSGMRFLPATISVSRGTVVTWVNEDSYAHTVTSVDGTSFNSGNIPGGTKFTFTATTVGTFNYQCNYHVSMGMVGVLTVTN